MQYIEQEVLPKFNQWVNSLDVPIEMKEAKKYAKYFLANFVDSVKAESRGAVYDLFEGVYEYAAMKKIMEAGQMDRMEAMRTDNLYALASGIVWAVEHDGFDAVKYDPIANWGMDINSMHGKKPM